MSPAKANALVGIQSLGQNTVTIQVIGIILEPVHLAVHSAVDLCSVYT